MLPSELAKTIYLGDRAFKSLTIDGSESRIVIQIDEISRVRDPSGKWNYYNDENIVDGLLVFSEVRSILFEPTGPIPNDYIDYLEAELLPDGFYRFRVSAGSVNELSQSTDVLITMDAKRFHLEDPTKPGFVIES